MTYGPLWALLSGSVMSLTDNRWIAFALFKIILGSFWLSALALTRRLTLERDIRTQSLAILMVGWLPASVVQSLGEGHNDIAMASLVLLWLWSRNSTALVAAVLMKYLAAPLALLLLFERRKFTELAVAALVGFALLAIFFRDPSFFRSDRGMRAWHFMTPRDAVAPLGRWAFVAGVPFVVFAVLQVWLYFQKRNETNRTRAVIAILSMVLFSLLPHIWGWYLILALLPAALLPLWQPSIWLTGLALAAPFSMIYRFRGAPEDWMGAVAFAYLLHRRFCVARHCNYCEKARTIAARDFC